MATTNYSWNLPTVGGSEDTWGTDLNANWTSLDTLLGGTNATEFAILDGATVTTAELNILDGVTATAAEINFVSGVTSALQTQLDGKAPLASPALTGVPTAPTAAVGTDTTQLATTAFVQDASPIVRLSRTVISGTPTNVDFTFDESLYDEVYFVLSNVATSANADLLIRTSNDDGSTYDSGASDYRYTFTVSVTGTTGATSDGSTGASSIAIGALLLSSSGDGLSGKVSVLGPSLAANTILNIDVGFEDTSTFFRTWNGSAQRIAAESVNGVRFAVSTGTFADGGVITMYGVKNS